MFTLFTLLVPTIHTNLLYSVYYSCTRFYSCALPRATEVLGYSSYLYRYNRLWPLRDAARCTHERGGTGHRIMVETRAVHEYQ